MKLPEDFPFADFAVAVLLLASMGMLVWLLEK